MRPDNLPTRIGPAEFEFLGSMVAVRCPSDLVPLVQKAGGSWEPGSRRWLVERRRINPLIRNLRRTTDPLFRQAGIDLDGAQREIIAMTEGDQARELLGALASSVPPAILTAIIDAPRPPPAAPGGLYRRALHRKVIAMLIAGKTPAAIKEAALRHAPHLRNQPYQGYLSRMLDHITALPTLGEQEAA